MARKSLVKQAIDTLKAMEGYGRSKHNDKRTGADRLHIYSIATMRSYISIAARAMRWIQRHAVEKDGNNIKWLPQAKQYVDDYLRYLQEKGVSGRTVKAYGSALSKLYGASLGDWGVDFAPCTRAAITNNRNPNTVRSQHFSFTKNAELVNFIRCTGLRNKKELQQISIKNLSSDRTGLNVIGKGGKPRFAPFVGTAEQIQQVIDRIERFGRDKTWPVVHNACPCHRLRAHYACALYKLHARPIADISPKDQYRCRKELAGLVFDRRALVIVSNALGHGDSRGSTVVGNYLHPLINEMLGV